MAETTATEKPRIAIYREWDGESVLFGEVEFNAHDERAEQTIHNILDSGSAVSPLNQAGQDLCVAAIGA